MSSKLFPETFSLLKFAWQTRQTELLILEILISPKCYYESSPHKNTESERKTFFSHSRFDRDRRSRWWSHKIIKSGKVKRERESWENVEILLIISKSFIKNISRLAFPHEMNRLWRVVCLRVCVLCWGSPRNDILMREMAAAAGMGRHGVDKDRSEWINELSNRK